MQNLPKLTLPKSYIFRNEIIDPLGRLLNYYVESHSKVLVIRFDLRFPQDFKPVDTNRYISETIAYINKKYTRQDLSPMYFWTMEQHQSLHPHYHVVLLLDGQKIRSYAHVFANVEAAWGRSLGTNSSGCVHHCNRTNGSIDMHRNGLQIRRCDGEQAMQEQVQGVWNQISYLAKAYSKAPKKDGLRNFGMSRLPKPVE